MFIQEFDDQETLFISRDLDVHDIDDFERVGDQELVLLFADLLDLVFLLVHEVVVDLSFQRPAI